MAKTTASFALSDEAKALLKLLASKDERSQAYILEKLIKAEAEAKKVSLPE